MGTQLWAQWPAVDKHDAWTEERWPLPSARGALLARHFMGIKVLVFFFPTLQSKFAAVSLSSPFSHTLLRPSSLCALNHPRLPPQPSPPSPS